MSNNETDMWNNFVNDRSYDNLSADDYGKLSIKVDNFLEAIFLEPRIFGRDCLHVLKMREKKLREWKMTGYIAGGALFSSLYLYRVLTRQSGFYFKNFWILTISTGLTSYICGRTAELIGNKLYYEKIILKLANIYNITDDEIEELQFKKNEQLLISHKEENNKKSSLDSVKFKM